ncbi:MAG TPA: S8 family serine peptidase, partial [Burkholderiaceae bacterium]|nr:S8 family serine peptidase [Burkholderiaceae bacterium]
MNPLCIRARTACLVLALSACLPAGAATQARKAPAAQDRTAHGLIVQLRDAPTHEALARERAQARGERQSERERARWQAVLDHLKGDAALARAVPLAARGVARRDPVGASAQVLRFERPLSAGEAEHVMQSLAARPEVAWVEPNVRERPQQMASAEPSDYYYRLGLAGQWWLRDVGQGGNASPIEMRLRGVPGFVGAWFQRTVGSPNAVVAVLDTGITCHPDLGNMTPSCIGGAILPGYDFVADPAYANDGGGRDADPRDPGDWVDAADRARDAANFGACDEIPSSWHGTAIAGQLAALTNGGDGDPMRPGGVAAMNWNGRVLPVRVAGKCGADVADIV